MKFEILGAGRKAHNKLTTLDIRRASFGLFRDLLGRVTWKKALQGRGAKEIWVIFNYLLQAKEPCIPTNRKSGNDANKPA